MEPKDPRLYRRKKTWWVKYYVFDGIEDRLVRHSLKTTDEKEAQKKLVNALMLLNTIFLPHQLNGFRLHPARSTVD